MASSCRLILAGFLLWRVVAAQAPAYPYADISNGLIKARLYLPDNQRGYYRGTRFDWSGVVPSLTYQGHEFFGQWFPRYDPLLHDAISGPVEEFRSKDGGLGYAEAKEGGMFVKIGVGVLRKDDNEPYNFARTYQLLNPGRRIVRPGKDRVQFVHELNDGEGYAYVYTKTLRLPAKKAELVLEHSLKNTGKRTIVTGVYNHDFYMLGHLPTGPDVRVKFTFKPAAGGDLAPAYIEGNELRYKRELAEGGQESAMGEITGYGPSPADNDIRAENLKAGVGVREQGDRPIQKIFFWSIHATVCPEVYIHIDVAPGKTFKWRTVYQFYTLDQEAGTKTKATGDGT